MFTFTKIISAVMAFIMMMLPLAGEETEQKCKPEFTGTFIQSWMTASWDDERWAEEAENMKEAGVNILFCSLWPTKVTKMTAEPGVFTIKPMWTH